MGKGQGYSEDPGALFSVLFLRRLLVCHPQTKTSSQGRFWQRHCTTEVKGDVLWG